MALVSSYDPRSQAGCPKCEKTVDCYNIGGITFGNRPYLDFYHAECGTKWRYYIYTREVDCPIPKPPCGYCGGLHDDHSCKNKPKPRPFWANEAIGRLTRQRDRMSADEVKIIQKFLNDGFAEEGK